MTTNDRKMADYLLYRCHIAPLCARVVPADTV